MKAKRAQLVCQHLENISRHALENHAEVIRKYVRARQGVYALYRRGKLYYVGLAKNLRTRLAHHLKDRHGQSWDRFSIYLTIGDRHLRELEALILRTVKPVGNKHQGKFARSDDLRRCFRRDVKQSVLNAVDDLFPQPRPQSRRRQRSVRREGRQPVLAKYISHGMGLTAHYRGRSIKAHVLRSGIIRFAGRVFTSPSLAAAFACKRRTCNGWTFWHYERAPGDWVLLDKMRK